MHSLNLSKILNCCLAQFFIYSVDHQCHCEPKFPISYENCFKYLSGGKWSFTQYFFSERSPLVQKNHSRPKRPQGPKRPKTGHQGQKQIKFMNYQFYTWKYIIIVAILHLNLTLSSFTVKITTVWLCIHKVSQVAYQCPSSYQYF